MTILSVRREYAAEHLNEVANHPEVRPWLGGDGTLDLSSVVANPANVLLMADGGGVLFHNLAPGLYEAHTQFLPEFRGEYALNAVRDALYWMFSRTDCTEVVTRVPEGNSAALGLVRSIRGTPLFERPNAWQMAGEMVGVRYFSTTLAEWVRHEDRLVATGDAFHVKLAEAKAAMGGITPVHDEDDAHDRYVGAAMAMMGGGQIEKGLAFYNRWAVVAGYATISMIGLDPPLIDIRDAVLAVRNNDFDVLLVR